MYESTIIGCSIAIIILIAFYAYFSALESAITLVDKSSWLTKSAKKNTRKPPRPETALPQQWRPVWPRINK